MSSRTSMCGVMKSSSRWWSPLVEAKIAETTELWGRLNDIGPALECGCCFIKLDSGPGHYSSEALWGIARHWRASQAQENIS